MGLKTSDSVIEFRIEFRDEFSGDDERLYGRLASDNIPSCFLRSAIDAVTLVRSGDFGFRSPRSYTSINSSVEVLSGKVGGRIS